MSSSLNCGLAVLEQCACMQGDVLRDGMNRACRGEMKGGREMKEGAALGRGKCGAQEE